MMLRLIASLLLCLCCSAQAAPTPILQHPIDLDVPGGALHGTLLLPQTGQPVPVVLILAGSGPTDRDGNNTDGGRTDSLKRLAWALARQGIASVRYDKRGVASGRPLAPDERQLSVEGYVADAVAWAQRLKADPRFGPLVLLGHSEGALIASLAAPQIPAQAVVSVAGSGRPIDQVLTEQLRERLPPPLFARSLALIEALKAGRQASDVPEPLQVVFRPSVQPYLISLFHQDPARAFAALRMPALIVQGRNDIQVSVADARALSAAKPDAQLQLIAGMNHVLRIVPMDLKAQLASYNQPDLPLAGELPASVVAFIKAHT
ncbi:alpha/beta hydrolase [Pseudomonas typographi]|uniref:Alpha/beta hydrolase n=1 Tax=Pseudomonas typographi TaxID=2715964 RepID=A0ABR7Z0S8_9PSED|nr:alpha/beta fold hydrolase [Pseudomonas typographi]MBD1553384.1 alpha/beta hydrolase [Pseudomonas typographi]MBD1588744.1 alpha/beta hydrolase [Pseudomonas typographi]MBD1599083.1 alpha/beta hydrolase [Pseudomonas typographi]